ncbi:MAG: (Fe-S)-binding protein, partial [Desulfotomaculaceae bacterium]
KVLAENSIGPLPSQRTALKALNLKGNPYNHPPEDRFNWLQDKPIKFFPEQTAEVLYYAGCTPSYDSDLQKIPRNIVKIMQSVGVDFGLHRDETCCGCSAKRLGDEYLFRDFVEKNSKAISQSGVKTVVTSSPHCYNTYKNEYGLDESVKIMHYTQFFADRLEKLRLGKELDYVVAYHDPCYLSKHNGVCDEPRELINSINGIKLVEMADHGVDSLCCGGGGGRMWAEVEEENRLGETRVRQALAVGANVLATACPWCYTMIRDAIKNLGCEDKIKVMDVTELLCEAMDDRHR